MQQDPERECSRRLMVLLAPWYSSIRKLRKERLNAARAAEMIRSITKRSRAASMDARKSAASRASTLTGATVLSAATSAMRGKLPRFSEDKIPLGGGQPSPELMQRLEGRVIACSNKCVDDHIQLLGAIAARQNGIGRM